MSKPSPFPPGLAAVVHEAVDTSLRGTRIVSSQESRRTAMLVTRDIVQTLEARWLEVLAGETRRVFGRYLTVGYWDMRRWWAARIVARRLPASVVSRAVQRMVALEYDERTDELGPLDVSVGEYVRRWEQRYPGCA